MGYLESLICGALKSRQVREMIKHVEVDGNIVSIIIKVPEKYSRVLRCVRELAGEVRYA